MLLKVKFLGHENCYNTIKPIHSKVDAIHKVPSPTSKVALMSFIGVLNFFTKFIEKLHIILTEAQMQLTKFSKLKIIHTPGKNLSVADTLSRSFTKTELQLNQLKYKQLPPQIHFFTIQNSSLTPVRYLKQHEETLPHQKHDSHPILADYGTDQFSIRINDKSNDIIVKPLDSFSFISIIPFQNKYKTPARIYNKSSHQQSLLLNDTDVTSDDDDHKYTRIPKYVTFSSNDQTNDTYQTPTPSHSDSSSTFKKTETSPLSTSVIYTTEPIKHS